MKGQQDTGLPEGNVVLVATEGKGDVDRDGHEVGKGGDNQREVA